MWESVLLKLTDCFPDSIDKGNLCDMLIDIGKVYGLVEYGVILLKLDRTKLLSWKWAGLKYASQLSYLLPAKIGDPRGFLETYLLPDIQFDVYIPVH